MLLEFSVENFLSFKEKTTFSMLPHESYKELLDGNVSETGGSRVPRVLNSAVIFGPNASGKTNFIKALNFMVSKLVGTPGHDLNETDMKFGFSKILQEKPTTFSILFMTENVIYDYSYSMQDGKIVHEKLESLENRPRKHMKVLFERSDKFENGLWYSAYLKGTKVGIFEKTRPEGLFLRSLYEWNNKTIEKAYLWLMGRIRIYSDTNEIEQSGLIATLLRFLERNKDTKMVEKLITQADLGIDAIKLQINNKEFSGKGNEVSENVILRNLKFPEQLDAEFTHKAIDEDGNEVFMDLDHIHESLGSRKLFALSGPIIDFIQKGVTFCIDELTSSMHPFLVRAIIDMFHDPKINTNGAQLIFNTHDVFFLNKKFFRRDQIWFAQKNKYGATDLTGLHDFDVRNDEALGAKYLMGAYGAIPIINHKDLYTFEGGKNGEEG
jgi:uncharacterized protein